MSDVKQWIILRKDLKMRLGKSVSQGAHASMGAILRFQDLEKKVAQGYDVSLEVHERFVSWFPHVDVWLNGAFTKICLFVNSEEELLDLYQRAEDNGLLTYLIQDNGQTEFNGVLTYTALAIGPAPKDSVKPLVGHLQLA